MEELEQELQHLKDNLDVDLAVKVTKRGRLTIYLYQEGSIHSSPSSACKCKIYALFHCLYFATAGHLSHKPYTHPSHRCRLDHRALSSRHIPAASAQHCSCRTPNFSCSSRCPGGSAEHKDGWKWWWQDRTSPKSRLHMVQSLDLFCHDFFSFSFFLFLIAFF